MDAARRDSAGGGDGVLEGEGTAGGPICAGGARPRWHEGIHLAALKWNDSGVGLQTTDSLGGKDVYRVDVLGLRLRPNGHLPWCPAFAVTPMTLRRGCNVLRAGLARTVQTGVNAHSRDRRGACGRFGIGAGGRSLELGDTSTANSP